MTTKFRKKPVVIEAVQYDGTNRLEIRRWCNDGLPAIANAVAIFDGYQLLIRTGGGFHVADVGDWIIKGVKGEFYPCKPDIFAATYEIAQPLAGEGSTPPGTPQQTHAETLAKQAENWIAMSRRSKYGDRGLRLQMEGAQQLLAELVASLRAPVGTCETCQHAITNGQGQFCGNRNSPLYHMGNIGTLNARHVSCSFHTPRPETPQEEK